ncbi:hypothetical protein Tco_0942568, partial [Tanacetum coccineum]
LMLILFVDNHPELVDLLGDVSDAPSCSDVLAAVNTKAHPSNATKVESTFSDSNIEDAATNNESKDDTFSNALIAEMEADMYGLQHSNLSMLTPYFALNALNWNNESYRGTLATCPCLIP